jgi:excisionase family DNA binding protein
MSALFDSSALNGMSLHRSATAPAQADELLTRRDVARRCRVSLRTVATWIERKAIDYIKFGNGAVRFVPADVERFILENRVGRPAN